MDTVYVEEEIRDHPRVRTILSRHPRAAVIPCGRYGEVFNPRAQDFRLQKQRPALILAKKYGRHVLPAPPDYSIGAARNLYFSHMLNCLYDCRYCFLQGMYASANYVFFVNLEDFRTAIEEELHGGSDAPGPACFFSGYDCDSLALESLTGFAAFTIPFFAGLDPDRAWLELRTKSVNIKPMLEVPGGPARNVITAFSLNPDSVAREIEHGAPPVVRRIAAIRALTENGWPVGLRFDPLIACDDFEKEYGGLIADVFAAIRDRDLVHSVTVGPLRFPKKMHRRIAALYPGEPVLADERLEISSKGKMVSYAEEVEAGQEEFVVERLRRHVSEERVFVQGG